MKDVSRVRQRTATAPLVRQLSKSVAVNNDDNDRSRQSSDQEEATRVQNQWPPLQQHLRDVTHDHPSPHPERNFSRWSCCCCCCCPATGRKRETTVTQFLLQTVARRRIVVFGLVFTAVLGRALYPHALSWWSFEPPPPSPWPFSQQTTTGPATAVLFAKKIVVPHQPHSTLALLVPPGLLGGYHNQVIRFTGWIAYAYTRNLSHALLPSLLWSTRVSMPPLLSLNRSATLVSPPESVWTYIPMEWVFDIDFWNKEASFCNSSYCSPLPTLVERIDHSDCWTNKSHRLLDTNLLRTVNFSNLHPLRMAALQQGSFVPILNFTQASILGMLEKPRRLDLLPLLKQCQHPVAYGGGKFAGRLWNDYMTYSQREKKLPHQRFLGRVDEAVLRALRPAPHWRQLAQSCLSKSSLPSTQRPDFVVVHARIEMEMMKHACGVHMERNLTRILRSISQYPNFHQQYPHLDTIIVATSRNEIFDQQKETSKNKNLYDYARHNLKTLNKLTRQNELFDGHWKVIECGQELMDQYYYEADAIAGTKDEVMPFRNIRMGSLVEQVVNFEIALSATVFVGVKDSSYSNSVWTTRYFQGKGDQNYRYTKKGIEAVIGLPDAHSNC